MTFGDFVKAVMKDKGISYEKLGELVGKSSGGISNILAARPYPGAKYADAVHKPTLEDMPKWAEALQLDAQQTAELVELAELCHAPPALRARYLAMRQGGTAPAPLTVPPAVTKAGDKDLAKARAANALLVERLAEVEARLAKAEAELAAHRQEQAALADLLSKPAKNHDLAWEPDTSALPPLRVADAPEPAGTKNGPYRS